MTHLLAGLLALTLAGNPPVDPDPTASPPTAPRQGPGGELFHLELRGGIGIGEYHGSISDGNRSAGGNWGIRMGFQPLEQLVLSLGYGQSSFGCDGGLCAQAPVSFSGSGVEVEAATDWKALRMGAGLTRQTLGAEWVDTEGVRIASVAAPAIGWFLDLSADIPVSTRFSLAPGVRYMRHGADFGSGDSPRPTVQILADVGVRYRLPAGR